MKIIEIGAKSISCHDYSYEPNRTIVGHSMTGEPQLSANAGKLTIITDTPNDLTGFQFGTPVFLGEGIILQVIGASEITPNSVIIPVGEM